MLNEINLFTWFTEREMSFPTPHFVYASGKLSPESKQWVLEKLTGRFYISPHFLPYADAAIAFEDPQEALFYELKWS